MRNFLINLLSRLLGLSTTKTFAIPYLFGANTGGHEARKRRWEYALKRLWSDKDLLDYLYYQSESDKENYFKGKVSGDLNRGARLRTIFIIYQAHRAHLQRNKDQAKTGNENQEADEDLKTVDKTYKNLVDID